MSKPNTSALTKAFLALLKEACKELWASRSRKYQRTAPKIEGLRNIVDAWMKVSQEDLGSDLEGVQAELRDLRDTYTDYKNSEHLKYRLSAGLVLQTLGDKLFDHFGV